jgi:uncharacterized protein (PEP-CTERM system associated)
VISVPVLAGAVQPASLKLRLLCWGAAVVCGSGALSPSLALAQTAPNWSVAATAELLATHSRVNRAQSESSDDSVQIRPGVRLGSRQGWLQGAVDYSLSLEQHSSNVGSEVSQALSANLLGTLIRDRLTVAANANYGRRANSAFDTQSVPESVVARENSTEVGSVSIAPNLRGTVGGVATYDLRWRISATNQRKSVSGDSLSEATNLGLRSSGNRLLGWSVNAERSTSDFRVGGESSTERAAVGLVIRPDVELELQLRAGSESQKGLNVAQSRRSTTGGDLLWRPGPRTRLSYGEDQRVFGRSSRLSFEHRMARSSFRFASIEDLLRDGNPDGLGAPRTLYDQLFAQFASQEPDPALRDQLVRERLLQQGLDGNATVPGGFVNAGVSVQRRHDLSVTYVAARLTVSGNAYASRTSRIDLASAGQEPIKQAGYSATASHRLSPTMSLVLQGSRNRTKAQAGQAGTDLKSLSLSLAERFGRNTTARVSARYTVFNSVVNAYSEAAATATLSMRY